MTRALAVLGALLAAAPAGAGPLVETLKARQARVDALLSRWPGELPPADKDRLETTLAEAFDFREMARAALQEEWERRGEAERAEYAGAFEGLVRASLVRRTDIYRVRRVEYGEERVAGDEGRVTTTVWSKDATTEVDYRFLRSGGRWRLVDYAIDGVSTVRNYRSQFSRILARSGWNGLLERLRRRRAQIVSGT